MSDQILPPIIPIASKRIKDLTGKRFGRLHALGFVGQDPDRYESLWLCKCDCGQHITLRGGAITSGNTTSCGCYGRERVVAASVAVIRTHGMSYGYTEYSIWKNMRARCLRPSNPRYQDYGGRGIKICDRWNSFGNFFADMGDRPSAGHSLDRIDVDGNYCPENCRWATDLEQANNARSNRQITFNGETMNVSQWARKIGLHRKTLADRMDKLGWSIERALTEPLDPRFR